MFAVAMMTLVVPRGVRARADTPHEAAPPPPGMTVQGEVDVEDARVRVRCRTARQRSRCVVTLSFVVHAREAAHVTLPAVAGGRVQVDGDECGPPRQCVLPLAGGERRRITVRTRRALWETRSEGLYLVAEAAWTRHALLGEFQHIHRGSAAEHLALFEGPGWSLRGSFRVDAPPARRLTVSVDGQRMPGTVEAQLSALPSSLTIHLEAPRETPRWLRRGGPLFMLGTTMGSQRGFIWRAGYEAGFGRHGFLQGLVETDFRESVALVLMLEAALISPLYIIPSLSAGAGFRVETRAGPQVALRFALGANLGMGMGLQATLDWDVRGRRATTALAGRLGF